MALNPNQLTAKQSPAAADTIASAIWDAANGMDVGTARDASAQRMLRRHAEELVDLHDSLDPAVVLLAPSSGHDPNLRDVRGPMGLDRAEN